MEPFHVPFRPTIVAQALRVGRILHLYQTPPGGSIAPCVPAICSGWEDTKAAVTILGGGLIGQTFVAEFEARPGGGIVLLSGVAAPTWHWPTDCPFDH